MLKENICFQVTARSLCGEFGKEAQQCAQYLLRQEAVDVIATDAHSTTYRKPRLSRGMQAAAEIVGQEAAQRMVFGTPMKIFFGLALG